ncbi:hypothetical protein BN1723_019443, partial [Verticillium longisporum]
EPPRQPRRKARQAGAGWHDDHVPPRLLRRR